MFAFLVIGYVAYTGADVSNEYDSVSKVRNIALNEVVDPIAKKVLKEASESELDKIVDSAAKQYQKGAVIDG
ncbi:hypothetical protein [Candidatus Nitrosotenuis uzonensis]|uniref:hypothetical protein n=1 Tax=Candidatus Nitrosotenuis uzonensis TaxID=1407055 RepID=UPI00195F5DC5|nr:hypothetical protein [Candidatus Nitrosotenuis uzonensis]